MKVLFFISSLRAGGKERRFTELLKALKLSSDIDFEIVLMSKEVHYEEILSLNTKIHYLIRKKKKDLFLFHKFYNICKKYKPDMVHCWDSMTAIYSVPACKLLKINLINGMVIDTPTKCNIFNKYWLRAKLTFPFSNIIIGNSKAGLTAYKAPINKSSLIYNGFNFQRTNNLIKEEIIRKELKINTRFVIGMVATFSTYKDYKTYFEAAQLILTHRDDITFLAIGSETDSALSKKLIDSQFMNHFRLLGIRSNIESYINVMDICVLSTFTEGISNSILEYMALSKPVIATLGGGTNEIVEDLKTGILISPKNPNMLEEKIKFLLNDDQLRLKMGINGNKRINDFFSISSMTNKYINIYKSLLKANQL
ncbi:MAG: glycosyltransferase [Ginsengibacter sp.]